MTETNKKKLLEFCGWNYRNGFWYKDNQVDYVIPTADLTTDWLFTNFVPAWNKANPEKEIDAVSFGHFTDETTRPKYCQLMGCDVPLITKQGDTHAEAFANACLKLIEAK